MVIRDLRGSRLRGMAGGRVVSGATSAVTCRRGISIQVNTHPDYLRRGYATAVGATLILECLERGIEPSWNAANQISAHLAEKLGYVDPETYEELVVEA